MYLLENMNNAVAYIEKNLQGEMDYAGIAKSACCSQYHFQRMFAAVTDVPLSEYIRRRRLTLAAFELQNTEKKIIDIALQYGYNSSDAFTRAFQNLHGITPSKARDKGVSLKAYPCMTFTLSIKGVVAMKYRMEEKEGFRVAGVKEWMPITNGEQMNRIPKMWERVSADNTFGEIMQLSDREPFGVIGICADMYNEGFDYWIAAATTKDCPKSMDKMDIPASTWAIFEVEGPMPGAMQEVWGRIFSEWLPTSGYDHAKSPEIEWYSEGDMHSPNYKSEIWIPVVKK